MSISKIIQRLVRSTYHRVYHPDSPGIKLTVKRGPIKRVFYPEDFATLNESIQYSKRIRRLGV